MSVAECRLIELPKIDDARGSLTFLEGDHHIPFAIARAFYIYDLPEGTARGGHAHYDLHQFLVCMSGGLTVSVDDGTNQRKFVVDRPWVGLHIPPMIWASEAEFQPGTVYLVLASARYAAASYMRDYEQFLKAVRAGK